LAAIAFVVIRELTQITHFQLDFKMLTGAPRGPPPRGPPPGNGHLQAVGLVLLIVCVLAQCKPLPLSLLHSFECLTTLVWCYFTAVAAQ
jgi:hypothetical protein